MCLGPFCEQQQQQQEVTTDRNEIYNEIKNRTNTCRAHLFVYKLRPFTQCRLVTILCVRWCTGVVMVVIIVHLSLQKFW